MTKYTFSFIGRQTGAIGITYPITETYDAKDIHEALSLLYEDYDQIRIVKSKRNSHDINVPEKINFVSVRSNTTRKRNEKTGSYI